MAKIIETDNSNAVNLISQGTEITGDIKSTGDIRIDGILNGNMSTRERWSSAPPERLRGKWNAKTLKFQA